jgi:hypothetical protein
MAELKINLIAPGHTHYNGTREKCFQRLPGRRALAHIGIKANLSSEEKMIDSRIICMVPGGGA